MNNTHLRFISSAAAIGTIAGVGIVGLALPASAADPATNSRGECLATPSSWTTVDHGATFRDNTTVTPGTSAEFRKDQRWSRDIPAVKGISETQYTRVIPGSDKVEGEHWKYSFLVPGLEQINETRHQYSRTNPGKGEAELTQFQYSREIPPVLETKYKKPIVGTEYQYQKYVQGVVQVKQGPKWASTGDTFAWEVWSGNLTKWSSENKDVIESGGHSAVVAEWNEGGRQYRKLSTDYRYQNTGATRPVNTGQFEYGWFETNPGSPWISTGLTQVKTAGYTEYYASGSQPTRTLGDANWTQDAPGGSWVKINERKVTNPDYIAPFTEYRAQDGSPTTDVNNAGWFVETAFDGWNYFGIPKEFEVQKATEDQTFYLTRDGQGNLGESTNPADAAWFESSDGIAPKWDEFGRTKFTKEEAVEDKTVFLTVSEEGVVGETEDRSKASWIDTTNPDELDLSIWKQMVDEHGDPLVRTVVEAVEGYTEYYVPGGQPTRILGDSNWTTDKPAGWTFVDDRDFELKKAVPPVTTVTKVLDTAAWSDKKFTPATYKVCELATTGSDPAGVAVLASLLALGGAAAVVVARKRGRHLADSEMINS